MTTFFLARHGETVWHAEHRYAGNSDVALTRHGEGWTREQDQFINYARSHGSSYKLIAHTLGTRDRLVIGRINNLRAKRPA